MKKFSIAFGLLTIAIIFSSCEKNHVCECVTFINEEEQPKIDNTYPIENLKKRDAIDQCNKWDSTVVTINFDKYITNCELTKK